MNSPYLAASGLTRAHFSIFQAVAHNQNRIIVVRNTNVKSTFWIEKGYPPKPKELEALHTSENTGKVTAMNDEERSAARHAGFFVIEKDGIARRNGGETLEQRFPFNTPEMNEVGQVIHPKRMLALVGDYDLMGVIDPSATGRVIALHSSYGRPLDNRTNPDVDRTINELNARMDEYRVMHGPQDLYKSFRGPCTAFFPNGSAELLDTEQKVRGFYDRLNRQTITGSYRRGA